MTTPLESRQIPEKNEQPLRKSGLRLEEIQGRETVIYCPMCVDPALMTEIKKYEMNPGYDVIDFTCSDCKHEFYRRDRENDGTDKRYKRRDSYNKLRAVHGHRDSYRNNIMAVYRGNISNKNTSDEEST
jgi:hypothetical protein